MDIQEPQIHEVWTFGEVGVTSEVYPTAQVDIGAGFLGQSPKYKISYVPLNPVADYVYISDLNTRHRFC